ncbi:hypothetical protein CEXT_552331 [Caerostris extrusa]|uniref:Uncharacterized protein n=1 Tax=Caerostris extrusa TaxID=172846 RepID=A0AAV4NT58_CAEEX|nr:hypothetical protein CEXT_552331 [Caerostris extrusa]
MHIGVEFTLEKGLIDTGIRICRYPEERPLAVLLKASSSAVLRRTPRTTAPHRWLVGKCAAFASTLSANSHSQK